MRRDDHGATCEGIALPPPPTPPHKGEGEHTEYAALMRFKHKRTCASGSKLEDTEFLLPELP